MFIKQMIVGSMSVCCYILACESTGQGMIIDPGGDEDAILAARAKQGITVVAIVNTHGHPDHVLGLADVPVLAELAGQVAAGGAEGKYAGTGIEIVERFLLDWVNMDAAGFAVYQGIQFSVEIDPHPALSPFAFIETAAVMTQTAFNDRQHF